MVLIPNGLTPTERRIWDLLADGKTHTTAEVLGVCDAMADKTTLKVTINRMRKKLGPLGYDVVARWTNKVTNYSLMRTIGDLDER